MFNHKKKKKTTNCLTGQEVSGFKLRRVKKDKMNSLKIKNPGRIPDFSQVLGEIHIHTL